MWRRAACVVVLGSCLLIAACAGPVPGYGAYRHAALQTAMAMVSDLASAQLAAELGLRGQSFPAFTDGNVTDAENDAGSVNSTFSSRQPPDARSDVLRQKMLRALSGGTSALTDLRVAVRMQDWPSWPPRCRCSSRPASVSAT